MMLLAFFALSFASKKFRLPSVLLYIVLGAAVSSLFLESELLHIAAEIGIVLLFFILGLEFPLNRMIALSRRIWPSGFLDVALNLGGAMGIALLFGMDAISAFTIGSIAYATSSSISAKMLDEKKRLANPETEFILALLIFEDLVAPVVVSFIASVHGDHPLSATFMGLLVLKIIILTAGAVLLGHFAFKRLNNFVSKYIENDFMPLLAVGLALGYAGLAVALGLSEILGAFMAGVMLSETGRSSDIEHLLLPVRDLTLPFFFFWFGTTIHFGEGLPFVGMMITLVLLAILGKIVTAYLGSRWFGLSPKISLRAGFSMVHRGEFSAIIASLALPQLRIFSGVYILSTAFIGVYLFSRAPHIANWYQNNWLKRRRPKAEKRNRRIKV
ncbi:MAG: cation:proton antiporter [Deltaproteobacteria bacterium]|nr:cation:proton antiporter [Deltaproteobacteria bacterium]